MELKHSLALLSSRYSLVFKLLIYFIILTAICVAVMVSIMTPAMDPVFIDIENAGLLGRSAATIMNMVLFQVDYATGIQTLSGYYTQLINIIENYRAQLLTFYILTTVVFFFYRLFVSMTSIPIATVMNDYMNTSVHKGFVSAITENIWVSIKYAFCATIINQLINTALGIMTYQIIMSTVAKWSIFSITFALLILIIILSAKYSLLLGWIPIIVNEKKTVLVAFVESIKRSKRWFRYGYLSSFMLYLLVLAFGVLFGIATCFIMVPIVIVSEMVMLRAIELVVYYNSYKKRYYIDRNTIINPREELY